MNENTFRENILKSGVDIRRKFVYDGSDYTDLLLRDGVSMIRRDVHLSAGTATLTLDNSRGTWNFLKATNTALGDSAQIQVYIEGDPTNVLTLLDGNVDSVRYDKATAILAIKDHANDWLDKKMGSNQYPAVYYAQTWSADDLVWDILRDHAGLDGTANPSNPDIDFTSFAAWRDQHTVIKKFAMEARPTGHTVAAILMKICQHTHSYIYNNRDGKVAFAPPFQPGYSYDEGNTAGGRNLTVTKDNIINTISVRYAYNSTLDEWVFVTTEATDAGSIAQFGTFPIVIEDRIVWHMQIDSAESDRDDTLREYAYPHRFFVLKAGPPGIMEDLCNEIKVSDELKAITNADPIIEEISYDLNPSNFGVIMKARWPW